MKRERLRSARKNRSSIACFFGLWSTLLILSLSFGTTQGFAKDISGVIRTPSGNGIGGVTITFSKGGGVATTDNSGYYIQNVKKDWSGTATPSKAGYTFDPAYVDYNKVKSDQTNQDYTGIVQKRSISGYIRTLTGNGLSGVTVTFDNGGGTRVTDSSGYYNREVTYGWGGTVTPLMDGYSFVPESRSYVTVTGNQLNQDYMGTQDPLEPSSSPEAGGDAGDEGDDGYGCFVGCITCFTYLLLRL